jgi:hypothetical protein
LNLRISPPRILDDRVRCPRCGIVLADVADLEAGVGRLSRHHNHLLDMLANLRIYLPTEVCEGVVEYVKLFAFSVEIVCEQCNTAEAGVKRATRDPLDPRGQVYADYLSLSVHDIPLDLGAASVMEAIDRQVALIRHVGGILLHVAARWAEGVSLDAESILRDHSETDDPDEAAHRLLSERTPERRWLASDSKASRYKRRHLTSFERAFLKSMLDRVGADGILCLAGCGRSLAEDQHAIRSTWDALVDMPNVVAIQERFPLCPAPGGEVHFLCRCCRRAMEQTGVALFRDMVHLPDFPLERAFSEMSREDFSAHIASIRTAVRAREEALLRSHEMGDRSWSEVRDEGDSAMRKLKEITLPELARAMAMIEVSG